MVDFSKVEFINNPNGSATIIFDLDDFALKELESLLGEGRDSQNFQSKFEDFVTCALTNYISAKSDPK
jgi:hypothetical protein